MWEFSEPKLKIHILAISNLHREVTRSALDLESSKKPDWKNLG